MRIVYVEDEDRPVASIKPLLEQSFGAEVVHFTNAEGALAYLRSTPADIIVSDYNLMRGGGHMNGAELAMALDCSTPFILCCNTDWLMIQAENNLTHSTPATGQPITAYLAKTKFGELPELVHQLTSAVGHRSASDIPCQRG